VAPLIVFRILQERPVVPIEAHIEVAELQAIGLLGRILEPHQDSDCLSG
jgi:hypothetical protein